MLTHHSPASVHAVKLYSHAVEVASGARLLFVSGQVGQRPDGTLAEGIGPQTAQAAENLKAVLADAGMGPENLVKLTIFLIDPADAAEFGPALGRLSSPPPAITLVYVKALATPELRVEIEAVAAG